eukprot:Platyproteum_vivax@DN121_c0_g1_i1.p1
MSGGNPFETIPPIGLACACTAFAMYPVDVVRALKMASAGGKALTVKEFVATHGYVGLLSQGVVPEVLRATWMRVLKFFFFPITHEAMWKKPTSQGTPFEKAIAGSIAVIPEVLTITSLELAKIGLQTDSAKVYKNSPFKLLASVYKDKGLTGVMCGLQGVQARQMLWTGTYFATLDFFKSTVTPYVANVQIKNFLAGFAAGVAGAIVNTPADVIRTNIQRAALTNSSTHSALELAVSPMVMYTMGSQIVANKGAMGLFSGLLVKSAHMGGSGAFIAMLIPFFANMMGIKKSIM